ncbi:MAG: dihydrofolate reductase family protein [Nitrososphaerales archaeon]
MRKVIVLSFITLDGVMQAPGGPQEDTSNGFKFGGWSFPYFDEVGGEIMSKQMGHPFDLLLGRKTYEIFASHWPMNNDPKDPIGSGINRATKYVASHSQVKSDWAKTVVLQGDVAEAVKGLKQQDGPELQVHGSGNLIQTLLKHDLVDELWLKVIPITLGTGKRLFADGTMPAAFTLTESRTSPKGVIFASFRRAGEVATGSF